MPTQRLFVKNRALGYVSNHVPLCVRYIKRRKENFVITCVGNSFHTYNCENLALLSVSGSHASEIEVLAGDAYLVYTACGTDIFAWRRGFEQKHVYSGHSRRVHLLLPFGLHLISVDEGSDVRVWIIKTEELYLELNFDDSLFHITAILHPSSYTNKVLLGSQQGQLQLWNLHTAKLIHSFQGWGSSITVLEQSPAVDVAAIGLSSGRIILHNLLYDETLMDFSQDWGPITSIAFRTDGPPFMLSGSPAGHIVVWDLEKRCIASQIRDAHVGSVTGMRCLPKEPVFVTSSPDNSLKTWIFDLPNDQARLLGAKEGHSAPPLFVRFHNSDGRYLISSGADSYLRIFSTISERFNKSLGRASYNRKSLKRKSVTIHPLIMPPVTFFASEGTRGKDWDDIACAHSGLAVVTTWSFEKSCMGSHKLLPPNSDAKDISLTVTSLCLSHCGNFVIVGYSSGHVHRFNMQSGLHRGSYGLEKAHETSVRGLAVDNLNRLTVSGEADGIIKFWHFNPKSKDPISKLVFQEGLSYFRSHCEASLLAVIMEDFSLCIVDLDTHSVVRKLEGHSNRITDASFSPDARWLITASMDCSICVWDVPSGKPVDHFRLDRACTSLAFSSNGQYLATTHVDLLGIYLWCNRSLYSHISLRPCLSPVSSAATLNNLPLAEFPQTLGVNDIQKELGNEQASESDIEEEPEYVSPEQIAEEMITLSSLAGSRWQNLLNIDIIRRKNKPKKPPEAPTSAPFFLPTIPALEFQFDIKSNESDDKDKNDKGSAYYSLTVFGNNLLSSIESEDFTVPLNKLKSLGPTSVDYEIGLLSPENCGSSNLLLQFMKMIDYVLGSKKDFELAQAYLGLFLKVHGKTVALIPQLREFAVKLLEVQKSTWADLQGKILFSLCVVQSLKNI